MNQSFSAPGSLAVSTIIVVDDSVVQRAFAVELCRELGIPTIYQASDGEKAMALLRTLDPLPDVALIDLEMPGMDGVELAEQMHAADMLIPVVIASSRDQELIDTVGKIVVAFGLRLLGGLQKPLNRERLLAALQSF